MLPDSGGTSEVSVESLEHTYSGYVIFVQPRPRLDARTAHSVLPRVRHWFWSAIAQSWPIYGEVLVASLLINVFALVTPFFSMNIYDRVVPNLAYSTLWVLTIGAACVFCFDLLMRTLRAYFIDVAGKRADITLSAKIFATVVGIRMAGRPASVGAFANNVQEFESFREFVTSATITTLVDLPFAILFVLAMAWIGGPIAWIPLVAFPIILCFGFAIQQPLSRVVQESFRHSGHRQAVLVESLSGVETLKTQCAEGPAQARWERAIGEIARLGLRSRFLSGAVVNVSTFVQQVAYVGVVFYGVYLIAAERLTVGGLIALFERAVGLYAGLLGINAYHQPGVEAGKKAAASILALQGKILAALSTTPQTPEQVAAKTGAPESAETVYLLLEHLALGCGAERRNEIEVERFACGLNAAHHEFEVRIVVALVGADHQEVALAVGAAVQSVRAVEHEDLERRHAVLLHQIGDFGDVRAVHRREVVAVVDVELAG